MKASFGCALCWVMLTGGCSSERTAYVPPPQSSEGVVCNNPTARPNEVVVDDMSKEGAELPFDLSAYAAQNPMQRPVGTWIFQVDTSGSGQATFPLGTPLTRPAPSPSCPDKNYIHVSGFGGKSYGGSLSFNFLIGVNREITPVGGGASGATNGGSSAGTTGGGEAVGGSTGGTAGAMAGAGGSAAPMEYVSLPFDLSAFKGMSFYLRSSVGSRLRISFPNADTEPSGDVCDAQDKSLCYNHFGKDILAVGTEWTRYDIEFAEAQQAYGWGLAIAGGLDTRRIYGVSMSFFVDAPFDLWVDRVVLIRK